MRNTILQGDALDQLRTLPDGCVQTCVTSPPYWGLRDYGVPGQLGLERTPAEYLARMVEMFAEVRRVLRADGTCWVNMGDAYANDTKWGGATGGKHVKALHGTAVGRSKRFTGLKAKDRIGMPWRLAFALQEDGWWLRSEITWCKPSPMPESVTDRPTSATEKIFLLTKSPRYYYDATAIMEPVTGGAHSRGRGITPKSYEPGHGIKANTSFHAAVNDLVSMRNKRDWWVVVSEPFPDAHFATFPSKLIEPMILAGSSTQACETCGAPWRRVIEAVGGTIGHSWHDHSNDLGNGQRVTDPNGKGNLRRSDYRRVERGWQAACRCALNTGAAASVVLDPFMGSGTVALVARQWQRDYLGIELNPAYIEMAERRLACVQPKLFANGLAG